jgi:hypothetical protein
MALPRLRPAGVTTFLSFSRGRGHAALARFRADDVVAEFRFQEYSSM